MEANELAAARRVLKGDWADSLLELDTDFGALLDLLDGLALADDTVVVFAGDNGPEDVLLWRGSPGYWEGSHFAGGEGNLRTPCIVRWPGKIAAGAVSDDIMHVTDWFATILGRAGADAPRTMLKVFRAEDGQGVAERIRARLIRERWLDGRDAARP